MEVVREELITALERAAKAFPDNGVRVALERAVGESRELTPVQAPLVAAARVLAARMDAIDENGAFDDNGKLDNVTPSVFLKTCQALGFTLDVKPAAVAKPPAEKKAVSGVAKFRQATGADRRAQGV